MEWKKVKDRNNVRSELPSDKPFLCLWKGTICLCEWDDDIKKFYIGMMPACYLGFWPLERERETKITLYCELQMPEDY